MVKGWGKSKSTPKSKSGKMVITESLSKSFLKAFIATLEISLPVIVTPSMSGMFSINYVMDPEPRSCHERVRGLLALAPSNTEEYLYSQYHKCDVSLSRCRDVAIYRLVAFFLYGKMMMNDRHLIIYLQLLGNLLMQSWLEVTFPSLDNNNDNDINKI